MVEQLYAFDKWIFFLINVHCSTPILDLFFKTITDPHSWIIPASVGALIFIYFEKKRALIIIGLSLVTVVITDPFSSQIIKPLIGRLRPCHPEHFLEGANFLIGMKKSLSFPSSHSMNMFAQAYIFSRFYPKKAPYFFLFAAMIGISRIYVGVHYPSDVAGGALLGIITADMIFFTCSFFCKQFSTAKQNKLKAS